MAKKEMPLPVVLGLWAVLLGFTAALWLAVFHVL